MNHNEYYSPEAIRQRNRSRSLAVGLVHLCGGQTKKERRAERKERRSLSSFGSRWGRL